jgi:hypothetical protein
MQTQTSNAAPFSSFPEAVERHGAPWSVMERRGGRSHQLMQRYVVIIVAVQDPQTFRLGAVRRRVV